MRSETCRGRLRWCVIGLTSVCLMSSLGCSTSPKVITRIERVKILPPAALIEPTPAQRIEIRTNGDLVEALQAARAALGTCNADKEALRAWVAGQ